ncbi:histidine kinase [Pedobacter sp. FW305-3-2-15-E-R2A2]|jgi:sensor histidine kinase YesM|uniref:sensor histidine kinase n=1 Tax=Pedobacter sp. FW305-3-2-15-E-R2A2 TaxID=3140251 RepID=UPI00313FF342
MKEDLEIKNNRLQQLIVDKPCSFFRHALLLFITLVVIFYSNWQYEYSGALKYYRLFFVFTVLITMCYINMYVLVPLFFFKAKYISYFASLSLLAILCLRLMRYLLHSVLGPTKFLTHIRFEADKGIYEGFIILVPIILVTTMIKLFQRWTRDNERIGELKNIALRMELNELKNQINPHFLFNMLNGIKALVRSDPEKANLIIMKLSEFLRYQIYENNEAKTPLKSEITFLSNFLSLEMLRRDQLSIEIKTPEKPGVLNGVYVPPNLFTTFVENAVKHSADISDGASFIHINIAILGNQLHFCCTNSKDPEFIASDKKNSGLGLANIKRRLELLYQEDHSLTIDATKNQFTITLIVPI